MQHTIPDAATLANTNNHNGVICLDGTRGWCERQIVHNNWNPLGYQYCKAVAEDIVRGIHYGQIGIVTNGSYKQGWFSAAWVIKRLENEEELIDAAVTPGTAEDQSAYRAKIYMVYCAQYELSNGFVINLGWNQAK